VVHDFLAAEIPEQRVWTHADRAGTAAGDDLPDGGWGQYRRRLDLVYFSQARLEYERARKSAMLICATLVVPIIFAAKARNLWVAVALIGLAAASHQGFSVNLYTLVSDTFPQRAVGSVVGIGGFGGAVAGMMVATFTGFLLQFTGSYVPLFAMASSAYLVALLVIHVLVPKLEAANVG